MTRYTATIQHHSIANARIVPVGDTIAQAKRRATAEFCGEQQDAVITIYDTTMPIYGDNPEPGNQMAAAARKISAARWSNFT